jgi:hypothetical protein
MASLKPILKRRGAEITEVSSSRRRLCFHPQDKSKRDQGSGFQLFLKRSLRRANLNASKGWLYSDRASAAVHCAKALGKEYLEKVSIFALGRPESCPVKMKPPL